MNNKYTAKIFILMIMSITIIFGIHLFIESQSSIFEPVGRLAIVKVANPDMYPNHTHSHVLKDYGLTKNSKCVLVVHYAGDSNYRQYPQDNVTIIELGLVDPNGLKTTIDWNEVLNVFLYGPEYSKYKYRADGIEFDTLDEALEYVKDVAINKNQSGQIPLVFHGNVRTGDIFINPGCGFPLYVQIVWKEYGRWGAYYYIIKGLLQPYFNNPYAFYEISHAESLQDLYCKGQLNYTDY